MAKRPLDDLLPSPDEVMFMGEDLSACRALARQTEALVAFSGLGMAWWGGTLALASLAYILRYLDYLPPWLPISLIQAGLGFGGTFVSLYAGARRLTFITWQSKAVRTIWIFGSAAIVLFNTGCGLIHFTDMMVMNAFLCFIFGIETGVLGSLPGRGWLLLPAVGWLAAGFAEFFLGDLIMRQSVLGLASACFMGVPGLVITWAKSKPDDS
jgi:hypothetical protein